MKLIHVFLPMLFISISFAYGGSLRGTIRDAQSLIPLVGVNVTVHVVNPDSIPFPTMTDQNGRYSITGIIPGNKVYAVVTHKDGYIMSYARIDNLGSLDLVYDISLTPESIIPPAGSDSSTVFGSIMTTSANNGSLLPIANAQVSLSSGYQQFNARTNAEGKYTKNIPLGLYSIMISAEGYNNLTVTGIHVEQVGATVNAILQSMAVGISQDHEQTWPKRFALLNAYPNPFNPSAVITYRLPINSFVMLKIYDVLGKEVQTLVNERQNAGSHSVTFNATNLSSGVYLYRLQAGTFSEIKKLVLLR